MSPYSKQYLQDYAKQTAESYGLNPDLFLRQIQAESNWNPVAVSHAGAQGLLQFMPETAMEYGLDDPFDPLASIEAGAEYMDDLMRLYNNNEIMALAAYNWGMGNLNRQGLENMPEETRLYIQRITETDFAGGIVLKPGESVVIQV